ncbi:NaeI family type II restriction endonuclease [Candidatus Poriferisocius sp.]|uniref:NaeI family type II restriction endonuclease n=1 Tax=Candidatus Poriferisocius sp. TaxID=3101276 RepID=UPI003B018691
MGTTVDPELDTVAKELMGIQNFESRVAAVLRDILDQLYDGQRSGRYKWDQLHKTEKTHCGTLVEINMQREFRFTDGDKLDYKIAGIEVDCKYSQRLGGWMIPVEAQGELCLLIWANDSKAEWTLGLVRALREILTKGSNRDRKVTLSRDGMSTIRWLFYDSELPPNVLLKISDRDISHIMEPRSGAERIRRLFRTVQGQRIGRGVVATVAQQADYMKRIRANGGARSQLQAEGIIILGQYETHREIARGLGLPLPAKGKSVSARVHPAEPGSSNSVLINGSLWRLATENDLETMAPDI